MITPAFSMTCGTNLWCKVCKRSRSGGGEVTPDLAFRGNVSETTLATELKGIARSSPVLGFQPSFAWMESTSCTKSTSSQVKCSSSPPRFPVSARRGSIARCGSRATARIWPTSARLQQGYMP
jgi:hypothetical protein